MSDIFETMTRASGDLSGVFESDSEASYFYLYQTTESDGQKVLDSIRIYVGEPDFTETDVSIRWDSSDQKVGLFIRNVLWAIFDTADKTKFGGNYGLFLSPTIPSDSCRGFST